MVIGSIKTASISFLLGASISFYFTANYKDSVWLGVLNEQKIEAARILQEETENVIRQEREQNEIKTRLEIAHVESQKKLDNILVINRNISNSIGGLRDPGASREGCKSSLPATIKSARPSSNTTTSNRLSNAASEFLLEYARQADRSAEYAKVCHAWALSIKGKK